MDLEASPGERLELEYATQHFGFTPDSFVETISETVLDSLKEGLDDNKEHLKKAFRKKVSAQELDESFTVIQNKYMTFTEKVLENFSRYLKRNILIVPKNVVLPEDSVHVYKGCKSRDGVTNIQSSDVTEQNEERKQLHITSDECEVPSAEFYNGDNVIESIKGFDRQCKNTQNSKYKKAVLTAKLANLEVVASRQRKLLKKAEELQELQRIEDVIEQQGGLLDKKINVLRELLDNQGEGNVALKPEGGKSASCNKTDEKLQTPIVNGLPFPSTVNATPAEKRKLGIALYEDGIVATKFRRFTEDEGYSFLDTEKIQEDELESSNDKRDDR